MKGKIEELEAALQNCEMRIEFLEANKEQWKGQLHHSQDQVRSRDYIMGEAVTQIREVANYLQSLATKSMDKRLEKLEQMQRDMQEQMQSQMQEQLAKIQQEMKEQMMESQRDMMNQLSQFLVGRMDKGKCPMDNVGENNENPQYPPGFILTHVQTQPVINLQKPSVTIRPQ
ncbi:hypothetical protein PVK06_002279 [Gossypium arboreum]|uniref:Uncharacterized protein n=1 Tax=Gossypium arboreum TaxID=29729 RepID=A0ABR0R360_GOSAR|nr:hypothetical protein PVK06_002279 [Gossypium arboreum]